MEQLLPKNAIFLDELVQQKYPTVSLGFDRNFLNFEGLQNIQPMCFRCGSSNIGPRVHILRLQSNKPFVRDELDETYYCGSSNHLICWLCFQYCRHWDDHKPIEWYSAEMMVLREIKFECQWPTCKKIFGGSTLKDHEISCILQPRRQCPVDGCGWSGNLDEIKSQHFKSHENSMLLFCNVARDLQPGNDLYLLILGKFVLVRHEIEELGEVFEHAFTLELCKEEPGIVKPVGLVTANGVLLKQIEDGDLVKSISRQVQLFVCFKNV
ncbi:uncharacterized protein LOC125503021 [Dendroctonus ponderosae]|uniref:Uncharacterized protein n=1 Tax=Dendroctonus ponderosae TaxID=77166 RepID=U4U3D6_DENPD|nr:uncharacterized protein LOC125503021 [Dendroctonus ponderosae]ERL85121.1 hypothetical protein D910_02543 [Dendroctonus ponderosae]